MYFILFMIFIGCLCGCGISYGIHEAYDSIRDFFVNF